MIKRDTFKENVTRTTAKKPKKKLFTQRYWNGSPQHADNLQGDQSGVTTRKIG